MLYEPSAAELEKARAILSECDAKEQKSKMASMVGYVKRQPDAEMHKEVAESRGENRQQYLVRYMAYQLTRGQNKMSHTNGGAA